MFDKMAFSGLVNRFAKKLNVLSESNTKEPSPLMFVIASHVAAVNYPKGASEYLDELATTDLPLPLNPVISQQEIKHVTENFLDNNMGTLNDMLRAIWCLKLEEYIEKLKDECKTMEDN